MAIRESNDPLAVAEAVLLVDEGGEEVELTTTRK
jgi:hypothetical protein